MKAILVWFSVILSCGFSVTNAVECPAGFTISNTCSQASPASCCVPVRTANTKGAVGSEPVRGGFQVGEKIVCPIGYIFNGEHCIPASGGNSQIVQPPNICQQGFVHGSSGQCIQVAGGSSQIIQQPTVCQQGFVQGSSGHCFQGGSSQIIQQPTVCQQGFIQGSSQIVQQPTICQQSLVQGNPCVQQPIYMQQQIQPPPCVPIYQPIIPPTVVPTVPPTRPTTPTQPWILPTTRPIENTIIYINNATGKPERYESVVKADEGDTSVSVTLTNVIHTNNTIHAPVNITNHNIVNTPVYISESSHVEQNINEEEKGKDERRPQPRPGPEPQQKCCSVISPRVCRTINNEWKCSHQKYRRCGSFCIAPKIYLRTHTMRSRGSRLYLPPLRNQPRFTQRGPLNCSGCMSGQSYHCSEGCYTYDCSRSRGCQYQDQQEFCSEYGGEGCTEEDGYDDHAGVVEPESELEYPIN